MTFLNGCLYWPAADNKKTMQRAWCLHRRARVPCTACTTSSAHSSAHTKNIPLSCQNMFNPVTKTPTHRIPDLWIHWQLMYRFLKDTICPFKIHFCAFKSNCVAYFCWNTTFHCLNLWYTTVFFPESLSASTQKPCTNIHLFVFHIEICVKGSQFTSDVLETCCQFI